MAYFTKKKKLLGNDKTINTFFIPNFANQTKFKKYDDVSSVNTKVLWAKHNWNGLVNWI